MTTSTVAEFWWRFDPQISQINADLLYKRQTANPQVNLRKLGPRESVDENQKRREDFSSRRSILWGQSRLWRYLMSITNVMP